MGVSTPYLHRTAQAFKCSFKSFHCFHYSRYNFIWLFYSISCSVLLSRVHWHILDQFLKSTSAKNGGMKGIQQYALRSLMLMDKACISKRKNRSSVNIRVFAIQAIYILIYLRGIQFTSKCYSFYKAQLFDILSYEFSLGTVHPKFLLKCVLISFFSFCLASIILFCLSMCLCGKIHLTKFYNKCFIC